MHLSISVAAGLVGSALAVSIPQGRTPSESYQALRRSLAKTALLERDTTFANTMRIAKSFDGATLFSGALAYDDAAVALDVVCNTCYVTADISAALRVYNKFNTSAGIADIKDNIAADVANITARIVDDIEAAVKADAKAIANFDVDGLQWPTVDVDLSLAALVDDLPDVAFAVTLDRFDVYANLSTTLAGSASYALNLFTSQTGFGVRVDKDTEIGVFVTVDLLMRADGGVHMGHGFHLALDDGLSFAMDLFASNMSTFVCSGGVFELLPVTVDSAVVLNAVLRIGLHAGVGLSTGAVMDLSYRTGIDTVMFVDVANLTTIVAAGSNANATAAGVDSDCTGDFAAAGIFEVDVGAGIGVSMALGDYGSWGVGPTVQTPVYYTTVTTCAGGATVASAAATTTPVERRDGVLTTLSTSATYSMVACKSAGVVNCPASLQTTVITSVATTTVLTVPADMTTDATWPASTRTADIPTKAFGDAVSPIRLAVSGTPKLYTPPAATSTGAEGEPTPGTPGTTTVLGHTVSNRTRNIGIGVGVGVGVPLVALIVAGCVVCVKKRGERKGYAPVVTRSTEFK